MPWWQVVLLVIVVRLAWEAGATAYRGAWGALRLVGAGVRVLSVASKSPPLTVGGPGGPPWPRSTIGRARPVGHEDLTPRAAGPEDRETKPWAPRETPEEPGPTWCPRCGGVVRKTAAGWLHEANGRKQCPDLEEAEGGAA